MSEKETWQNVNYYQIWAAIEIKKLACDIFIGNCLSLS